MGKTIGFVSVIACLLIGASVAAADQRGPLTVVDSAEDETSATSPDRTDAAEADMQTANDVRSAAPILWVPRTDRGAPALREGGATRDKGREAIVRALVPRVDDAALTLSAHPALYWHLSSDVRNPVHFTLVDPEAVDPLVEAELSGPFAAGTHVTHLVDHRVEIETGRVYEWYVAIVPDESERSSDRVARGVILRLNEPALAEQVASASGDEDAIRRLAEAGIWYEALALAQQLPDERARTRTGNALLGQAGLDLGSE